MSFCVIYCGQQNGKTADDKKHQPAVIDKKTKGKDKMNKVLEILNERLSSEGVETQLGERSDETTLNVIIEGLGEDEDGVIVCEISRIPVEDEEGSQYYSFYTVIADKLEEEVHAATLVNLNNLNMELLLGAYGIVPETGTLFHKYVYKAKQQEDADLTELLYGLFVDVVAIAYNDYDRLFDSIAE